MKQLTPTIRYQIQTLLCNGLIGRTMARQLQVRSSTVIREIMCNGDPNIFRHRDEAAQATAALADRQAKAACKSARQADDDERDAVAAAVSLYDPDVADLMRFAHYRRAAPKHRPDVRTCRSNCESPPSATREPTRTTADPRAKAPSNARPFNAEVATSVGTHAVGSRAQRVAVNHAIPVVP